MTVKVKPVKPLRYAFKMIQLSKSEARPATILVDVQLQKTAAEEHAASLQELRQLVETLGWDIVGTLTQKSLMRALTLSEVLVADRLFATLDTTVRALHPETQPRILVSDTVGFIRNLPHDLVASFRSTLDEALDASLLLHVVDAADPAFRSHIQVTKEVLEDIGAGKLPSLVILNKIDIVDSSRKALLGKELPEAIAMSALNPQDIEALHSRLVTFFLDTMTDVELVVAYGKEGVLADIRKNVHVLSESYEEKGVCLKVKANPGTVTALKQRLAS